jgi:hypothetical protein
VAVEAGVEQAVAVEQEGEVQVAVEEAAVEAQ